MSYQRKDKDINMGARISIKSPHRSGEYASTTLRRSQGVFEPYSPLTSQGKAVLQFILPPTKDYKPDLGCLEVVELG